MRPTCPASDSQYQTPKLFLILTLPHFRLSSLCSALGAGVGNARRQHCWASGKGMGLTLAVHEFSIFVISKRFSTTGAFSTVNFSELISDLVCFSVDEYFFSGNEIIIVCGWDFQLQLSYSLTVAEFMLEKVNLGMCGGLLQDCILAIVDNISCVWGRFSLGEWNVNEGRWFLIFEAEFESLAPVEAEFIYSGRVPSF